MKNHLRQQRLRELQKSLPPNMSSSSINNFINFLDKFEAYLNIQETKIILFSHPFLE